MRKNYFANEESGFFVKQQRQTAPKMPMNGKSKLIFIVLSYNNGGCISFLNPTRSESNG
jgi:hypothetical protein